MLKLSLLSRFFSNTISNCSKVVSFTVYTIPEETPVIYRHKERAGYIFLAALVFYSDVHYRSLNITSQFYAQQTS